MPVTNALVAALLEVVYAVLNFYVWILIIGAVISWLVALNVVNPRNRAVRMIGDFIERLTEPVLRPIRNALPRMGVDLSPLIVIFTIMFIQSFIRHLALR